MQLFFSISSLVVFLIIYYLRKDLRKVMMWTGLLSVPLFLLKFVIVQNFDINSLNRLLYLKYFIETIVFGFTFGGIAAVIFEVLFHKKLKTVPHPHRHQLSFLIAGPIIFTLSIILLHLSFGISIVLGFLSQAAILIYLRKDLIWDSLLSGLFLASFYLIFYYLYFVSIPGRTTPLWFSDFTGIAIFGLPIEEFMAIFAFGLLWGPLYEGTKGYVLKEE